MAREIHRLTAAKVKNAKSGMNPDGGGLYLQLTQTGAKSWLFRYVINGKERFMGLGSLRDVSLTDARGEASKCRELVRNRVDPIENRKAQRAAAELAKHAGTTFKDCAKQLVASHEAGWRNSKHREQWRTTLENYAYPVLGSLAVQSVDTAHVMKAIEPIWATKTETASRTRARIEAVLDWATARGMRSGANCARWKGHLDRLLPKPSKVRKVVHHRALPYADIGAFMAKLQKHSGNGPRALEFLVLTASRTGEVANMRWPEVDLAGKLWTVPAGRMKGEREHRVPLSAPAVAILKAMGPKDQGLVFPGSSGRPLSDMSLTMLHRRMGYKVTTHGFRSTFRDWAGDRTSFPREVAEAALAHAIGDKAEQAYRRGDALEKRRRLMNSWAQYCAMPEVSGAVVALRA
jgi:integrase